jgi:hypothetical protein
MIAYCGLDCEKCGAYLATRRNDDALRESVARKWREQFHVPVTAENINCTGCKSDGIKTLYCETLCRIRACGRTHGVRYCSDCADYPCDRVEEIFRLAPQARESLEALGRG